LVEVAHQNDLLRFGHFQLEIDPSALAHISFYVTGHDVNLLLHPELAFR
jgi:hypothetical protein